MWMLCFKKGKQAGPFHILKKGTSTERITALNIIIMVQGEHPRTLLSGEEKSSSDLGELLARKE